MGTGVEIFAAIGLLVATAKPTRWAGAHEVCERLSWRSIRENFVLSQQRFAMAYSFPTSVSARLAARLCHC